MSPINKAAYLVHMKTQKPLEVRDAPYTAPQPNEIVVKVHAVAINPIDWFKAGPGFDFVFTYIKLPFVLGTDLAGEVIEVGPGVTNWKVGDRVVSFGLGVNEDYNTSSKSAFQLYTVCLEHMTSRIPDSMSYEEACMIPLGMITAACALFQEDQLNLQRPSVPRRPTGKTVLIWGGSTSVGCNAIQLAVAGGYDVLTTCSPKNFDLCKRLGAKQCFNYNSSNVVADIATALKDIDFAGAVSAGINSDGPCFDIVDKCKSGKFVSMVSFPRLEPEPTSLVLPRTLLFMATWYIRTSIKSRMRGISWKTVMVDHMSKNGIGKEMHEYLSQALATGSYVAAPQPEVIGNGLETIQAACDRQKQGMSAAKAVVSIY